MRAVAHSKSFAKKVGVPQSVGKEFSHTAAAEKLYPNHGKNKGEK